MRNHSLHPLVVAGLTAALASGVITAAGFTLAQEGTPPPPTQTAPPTEPAPTPPPPPTQPAPDPQPQPQPQENPPSYPHPENSYPGDQQGAGPAMYPCMRDGSPSMCPGARREGGQNEGNFGQGPQQGQFGQQGGGQ